MRAFFLRRALHAVFVLWGVVTAVFFLVRLTGDPTPFLVDQSATQQEIADARRTLGLDRALHVQYLEFLRAVPRGDFGASIREKRPAMRMVLEHLWPATVELAAAALVLSTVLAIPLGIASATHKNGAVDHAMSAAPSARRTCGQSPLLRPPYTTSFESVMAIRRSSRSPAV